MSTLKPCPCDRLGESFTDSCPICWRWYHNKDFRIRLGGPTDQPALPTRKYRKSTDPIPVTRSECPYLGAVVSFCTSCDPTQQQYRNVHRCEHPEHAEEMGSEGLVTRGQHCETCTYFPSVDSSV